MSFAVPRKRRVVVPSWRPIARTMGTGALAMPTEVSLDTGHISPELQKRLEAWRIQPTAIASAELVETAIIEGKDSEAIRAAQTLVARDSSATLLVKKQAELLLIREGIQEKEAERNEAGPLRVRIARQRTRNFPHEAFAWVDLALEYVIAGSKDAADR